MIFAAGLLFIVIILIILLKKYFYFFSFWKKRNVIGHYKIMEKIASGGMGTVYKVKSLIDKTGIFALKVMREELFEDKNLIKRFKREASIIDHLDHPNIVKIVERGEDKGNLFIVMELLNGITLTEFIKRDDQRETRIALAIMVQIADVIAFIHKKGILHKDLKPENFMLIPTEDNHYFTKLLDFGLARGQPFTRLTET